VAQYQSSKSKSRTVRDSDLPLKGVSVPADFLTIVTPAEYALINKARARDGEKGALRMAAIISRRAVRAAGMKDAAREKLMADDADHAWPPSMLRRVK
jgi:hypothetical protein